MPAQMTPLTSEVVPCCHYPITAAQLPDDRIIATLQSFCDALQLDYLGQVQRIRRQPILAEQLLVVPLITDTGWQLAEVLTTVAIPLWLAGIQITRLAPEKQELVLAFQREAVDTLYRHFYRKDAKQASQSTTTNSTETPRSSRQMTHKAFDRLHQVADTLHQAADALHGATDELDELYMVAQEEKEAMGDHIVALEVKQKALEERKAGSAAQARKQPTPQDGSILTAQHLAQVFMLARSLRARTGERIDAMLADLAETFGVENVSDIPDAGWEHVQGWFWQREDHQL